MATIKISVTGEICTVAQKVTFTAGSYGVYVAEVTTDASWDDLALVLCIISAPPGYPRMPNSGRCIKRSIPIKDGTAELDETIQPCMVSDNAILIGLLGCDADGKITRYSTVSAAGKVCGSGCIDDTILGDESRWAELISYINATIKSLIGTPTDEQVRSAVDAYADEHGITTGATAAEAAQIEQNTEDITNLKSDLSDLGDVLNDGNITYKNIDFEAGSINTNTGEPMVSSQIRSVKSFLVRKGNYVVHNPTDYRVRTFEYSTDGTYDSLYRDTPAKSDITRTLTKDTLIKVVLLSGSTDVSLGSDVILYFECGLKKELTKVVGNTNNKVNISAFNSLKGKRLLPMLLKPTVVFVDDDGQNSVLSVTKPIFDNIGLPFVIGCSSNSEIFANVEAVKALENVEIALHPINTDQDLTAKTYAELNEYFNNQLGYMYDNGISVENVIYGGANWGSVLCDVASRYFDCACSISSTSSGLPYSYNVPLSAERYALTRCKVTSASSLKSLENLLTKMLASGDSGLLIYYHHSWELADNADYRQKLADLLEFVKSKVDDGEIICTTLRGIWH